MFDPIKEKNNVIKFIRDYYNKNKLEGVILGISGGKDSGIVAALFVEALGKDKVIGFTLPCHSKKEDKTLAKKLSDYYGFKLYNFDLTNVFDTFKDELKNTGDFKEKNLLNSDINLKPRLRMSTLYYMAALFSSLNNKTYLVSGTSNKCELYVGYFTKGGDSVHDIAVIADFTVEEVIKIGEVLKVPKEILYKTPDDGLSNMTDEEKLGVKYKDIASYMDSPNSVSKEVGDKIRTMHERNSHKFNIPTYRR